MIRFFVSPSDVSDGMIRLCSEDAAHVRSLRLRPSEQFVVCNGEGMDYVCRLGGRDDGGKILRPAQNDCGGSETVAEIIAAAPSRGEPSVRCGAYIALMKGARLDYAVQKSVELGAHRIILFKSDRCVAAGGNTPKKTARLQRIALETAKQCGRGIVPEVTAAESFESALANAALAGLPLFCYEEEKGRGLKDALGLLGGGAGVGVGRGRVQGPPLREGSETVSVVTGPEGGFTPEEARAAADAGMISVSLGPRILRCETAPAAVLAAVMYQTGNM